MNPKLLRIALRRLDETYVRADYPPHPGDVLRMVSVSGGKDSTALYLAAVEAGRDFTPVFADTGHELAPTLEHVATLAERTGGPPVRTVRADLAYRFPGRRERLAKRWTAEGIDKATIESALAVMHPTGHPFLDLCLLRSGFPSAKRRFCTEWLKIRPIEQQVCRPHWETGGYVLAAQGIRADESKARMSYRPIERRAGRPLKNGQLPWWQYITRPLLEWTVDDVFAMHKRHNVEPNPLYALGASRVGCGPCIFARKHELRLIAEHHPEGIDRVREWEAIVGQAAKQSTATWFQERHVGTSQGRTGIDVAVEWSRTSRGGKQHSMWSTEQSLFGECSHLGACE